MKRIGAQVLLLLLTLPPYVFGQTSNASLSGTVSDTSGALIPGVTVTATNIATGVVATSLSNDAGVYAFASLLPGQYRVTAALPGFQTQTFTDVPLGNAAQARLNFNLQIGQIQQAIEVSVASESLLLESSSSVGDVLTQQRVRDLPLVNNNVLDLVKVMGGANITNDPIFGEGGFFGGAPGGTTFAGIGPANINVQRDGIPISDVRWATGINSGTRLNPDMVGEIRIVTAPVDAEMGRGNGQVQILTRSGANEFHGGATLNVQNSSLDPNTWANNRSGIAPPWRNLEEYTLSVGGPIKKGQTFFFALWDGQFARQRAPRRSLTLTPCAQRGIFRYFDNWSNGNILQPTIATGDPIRPVVDALGKPVAPTTNPDGSSANGVLRYQSVFGPLARNPTQADCSDAQVQGAAWDRYRTRIDPSGFISNFIKIMPVANNYEIGDGLNTAGHLWNQTLRGADNLFGVGEDTQRKQFNVRIDHNFNQRHRVNGSWSYERNWADDTFANWPENAYGGMAVRRPQVFTVSFTSTLSPSILNEARVGMMRTGSDILSPLNNPETGEAMRKLLPEVNGMSYIIGPGAGSVNFSPDPGFGSPPGTPSNPFGGRGLLSYDGFDVSPRWTYGDTLSWTKGAHSFKAGGEYRFSGSYGAVGWVFNSAFQSVVPNPFAAGGAAPGAPVTGIDGVNMPGLAGNPFIGSGNIGTMQNLLNFMSGSVGSLRQYFYINTPTQTTWSDQRKEPYPIRDFQQHEWAGFMKDDWKVHPDLTLNLGLRWEYYGVPYIKSGMTAGFTGGSGALFGISGRNWNEAFWKPGARADLTQSIFVGPNSPNEDQSVYERDANNFGPAVGFAWQLPWGSQGSTTLRGGYQLSYLTSGRANTFADTLGTPPGSAYTSTYTGDAARPYLDLTTLLNPVPVPSNIVPMTAIPITDRTLAISAFDPNYLTPYTQNLTLALTRNVTRNLTVDVKYIATLSRKLLGTVDVNSPNFLSNGLLEAFNSVRSGGESSLLDSMLNGVNLAGFGYGPIGTTLDGVPQTAGLHMRAPAFVWAPQIGDFSTVQDSLANGNYAALANKLSFLGFPAGAYLRSSGKFAENFIKTNPQFNTATLRTNLGHANYHSVQGQVMLRPIHGVSFQSTYTWSKSLGAVGPFTDPSNQAADYTLQATDRKHIFVTYGTVDLPMGPNKRLFGNSSGILARIVEGWQGSWIINASSGAPLNITAANMLYGNGVPDIVGNFDFDAVGVTWKEGDANGNYFANQFKRVPDPQCSTIAAGLRSTCRLQAIADSNGTIVLQNPLPGKRGTFGQNRITGPGTWSADVAALKAFRLTEKTNFQVRVDATNVFNHPQPSFGATPSGVRIVVPNPPAVNINDLFNPFGHINNKVGTRTFQLTAKVTF